MTEHRDRAPHHLSFGQRRRVAVATVLAMRPEILVLDEPSSNLDPAARRELAEILRRLPVTLLMVTHDLPYALELCDRSVILDAGRIVADGPTGDLLRTTPCWPGTGWSCRTASTRLWPPPNSPRGDSVQLCPGPRSAAPAAQPSVRQRPTSDSAAAKAPSAAHCSLSAERPAPTGSLKKYPSAGSAPVRRPGARP